MIAKRDLKFTHTISVIIIYMIKLKSREGKWLT